MHQNSPSIKRIAFAISIVFCMFVGSFCFGFQQNNPEGPEPSTFEDDQKVATQIRRAQEALESILILRPDETPRTKFEETLEKYLAADVPAAKVAYAELELLKFNSKIEGHDLQKALAELQPFKSPRSAYPKGTAALGKIYTALGNKPEAKLHFQQAYKQDPCLFANLLEPDSPEKNEGLIKAATGRIAKLMEAQHLTNFRLLEVADGIYQIGKNSDDANVAIEMFDQLFLSRAKTMDRELRTFALGLQNRLYLKQAEYLAQTGADTKTQLAMLENIYDPRGTIKADKNFAIAKIFMRGGKDAELAGEYFDPIAAFDRTRLRREPKTFQLLFDHAVKQNNFEAIAKYLGGQLKYPARNDLSDKGATQYVEACLKIDSQPADVLDSLKKYLDVKSQNKRYTPSAEFLHASGQLAMKLENYKVALGFFDKIIAQNSEDKKAIAAVIVCYEKFLESKK